MLARLGTRRLCVQPRRHVLIAIVALIALFLITLELFLSEPHVTDDDIWLDSTVSTDSSNSRALNHLQATTLCQAHNWPIFRERDERKIYDLFMLNGELDWLEIRLHTLAEHVDYFIIVESPVTFTGLPKTIHLQDPEIWARFAPFHDQIIYHVVQDVPLETATRAWDIEEFQRNSMFTQVIPRLEGPQAARPGDVIIVADVDEIPRPATMRLLRNCEFPKRLTLRSRFYYYSFQWLHDGHEWQHPQATAYAGVDDTILPVNLRSGTTASRWSLVDKVRAWWDKDDLWNAGWHCSSCFAKTEELLGKMGSFSHTNYNAQQFRDVGRMVDRIRSGLDLWDRPGETYSRIEANQDLPNWIKADRERFAYLLDRDGPNAGFIDYPPEGAPTEE